MKQPRLVKVIWRDAASPEHDGWQDRAEAKKFVGETCWAVGEIIEKDATFITLVGGASSGDDVHRVFAIPRGCVVKIVALKEEK